MQTPLIGKPRSYRPIRLSNWDLLRSLCMLAVVVVHSESFLGSLTGINAGSIASASAILCDPLFFALSGYFAIRPLKSRLFSYYSRKVSTIILPLLVYSFLLYLYSTGFAGFSIHDYIAYFSQVLTPWWFIPALIPFLVVAPFLNWLFEKLDERQIKSIAILACTLTAWGFISYVLTWAFRSAGHETLVLAVGILQQLAPMVMIPGSAYFMYFCLGYFFRRLAPLAADITRKKLIVLGLFAWAADVVCAYFGVDRFVPSFPWLFACIAALFIFDRIRIDNSVVQRILEWTGRRSYAIYLLQYTAIAIVAPFVYDTLLAGSIGGFIAPIRLLVWIGMVAGSYLLSLAVASVVDATLLKLVQVGYEKVVTTVGKRFDFAATR